MSSWSILGPPALSPIGYPPIFSREVTEHQKYVDISIGKVIASSYCWFSIQVTLGLPYGPKIDIWSLGCVLAELFTGDVLFANEAIQFALVRMQSWLGVYLLTCYDIPSSFWLVLFSTDGFPHWMLNEAPFRHKFFTAKGDVFLDDSKRDRTM